MKGDWHKKFKECGKLHMSDETYSLSTKAMEEDLPLYLRHIKRGGRVLECCCGPGYTAVPMSHHFRVSAFDRDGQVLNAARENGEKYGKDMEFIEADFFDIVDVFGKDSFDACSSGGVLEHFGKKDIRALVGLQLQVAPIVFASMPLFTNEEVSGGMGHGIEAHAYGVNDWLDDILAGYNIMESRRLGVRPQNGKFREFTVVVAR